MSSSTYYIEYAKTGRGGCKGGCRGTIPQGALKFATLTNRGEFTQTTWRCFPQCVTKIVATNCLERFPDTSILGGMELLTEDDQKLVDEALRKLQDGEKVEPWLGGESPKKKQPARKKAKVESEEDSEDSEEEAPKKKAAAKKKAPVKKEAKKKAPVKRAAKKKEESEEEPEEESEEEEKPKRKTRAASKKEK